MGPTIRDEDVRLKGVEATNKQNVEVESGFFLAKCQFSLPISRIYICLELHTFCKATEPPLASH